MEVNFNKMCEWERKKAIFLMYISDNLGYDLSNAEVDVNSSSGYVYVWSEDFNFSLYMPINCDLIKSDVWALWTNSEDGEEIEFNLKDDTTLKNLEDWVRGLEVKNA